jgi:hypothetical protein
MVKKVLFGIAGVLGVFVVGVLGLAATKPDQMHIERSLVMKGTPEQAFDYASDYTKFTTWIPWTELDPNQKMEFSSPPAGVGAWYTWKGNDDVGSGRMEILTAEPGKVVHKLEFIEPFESTAESSVLIEPAGEGQIEVTWTYDGAANFGSKVMQVFMDMDAMIGSDFDKGLANLSAKLGAG